MGYKENQTIGSLISAIIGMGLYAYLFRQHTQQTGYDPAIISSDLGKYVLIVIGVQIVLILIVVISTTIIQAIITRDEDPILEDERDQLFDLRAERVAFGVFSMGFVFAMILLATGSSQLLVFNTTVYSLLSANIITFIAKLYLYRRGF